MRRPIVSRRLLLAAAAPALLTCRPDSASAAFGPAGGAVISTPPLKALDVDALLALSPEKLAQRLGSFSQDNTKTLLEQLQDDFTEAEKSALDSLVVKLEDERQKELASDGERAAQISQELAQLQDKVRKLSRGLTLEKQVRARDALNAKLEAQPDWVVYGAAALASLGSTLVAHPIDTLKTKAQAAAASGDGDGAAAAPAPPTSITELYVGLFPNMVKEAPSSALYLGIYELVRGLLNGPGGVFATTPLAGYLVAGAVGELVGSVVRAPSEACKTLVQSGVADNVGEAVRQTLMDPKGRERLVRAWSSSLLRDVPMGAMQIAIFEVLKSVLIQSPDVTFDTNSLQAEAAFGAIGGLIGAVLTTPADVITTRIMTQQEADDGEGAEMAGPIEVGRDIWQQEGLAGFFKGTVSRGLYWAPAIGIFLSLYCSLRQLAVNVIA